jgi:hypothetical protein
LKIISLYFLFTIILPLQSLEAFSSSEHQSTIHLTDSGVQSDLVIAQVTSAALMLKASDIQVMSSSSYSKVMGIVWEWMLSEAHLGSQMDDADDI